MSTSQCKNKSIVCKTSTITPSITYSDLGTDYFNHIFEIIFKNTEDRDLLPLFSTCKQWRGFFLRNDTLILKRLMDPEGEFAAYGNRKNISITRGK